MSSSSRSPWCDWIDEGRTIDPACPGNSTHGAQGKVQATIAALGEREVSGAGGHADTAAEEVMSMDLPYPKSGHWDKQVRCDICSEGKSACQGGWTSGAWALSAPGGCCSATPR